MEKLEKLSNLGPQDLLSLYKENKRKISELIEDNKRLKRKLDQEGV